MTHFHGYYRSIFLMYFFFSSFRANSNNEKKKKLTIIIIIRTKTRSELLLVSAAVMGIEFSYAAETAFVSPTLLSIGVQHKHMTLVWALSPLVGFFLTPIMGSFSDRCRLNLGRRRPFIILFSIGIFIGNVVIEINLSKKQKKKKTEFLML